jgi:hypothetical protein
MIYLPQRQSKKSKKEISLEIKRKKKIDEQMSAFPCLKKRVCLSRPIEDVLNEIEAERNSVYVQKVWFNSSVGLGVVKKIDLLLNDLKVFKTKFFIV